MDEKDIHFDVVGGIGSVLLNRPKALNALTLGQIREMAPVLVQWATDDGVRMVVVEGAGEKAFCAGGDVRAVYDARQNGDETLPQSFFREEYQLNRLIKTFPKPYVAFLDGITMGGGVGISVHGSHRIVTERTMFAMPETGIGLFPDVGGTYFLPRCPGRIGMYLALTGARLKAADILYAQIGTHYVPSARMSELKESLRDADEAEDLFGIIGCVIDSYAEDPGEPSLAQHREVIDRCFGKASVEEIFEALAAESGDWAKATLDGLSAKSPTSLKVVFRQMQIGAQLDFDRSMILEYRMTQRFMAGHDFFEGVRAVLVDKDHKPQWQPANLVEITTETVESYFRPMEAGELTFI